MYNDFINEVVSEQTRSGKTPKPNRNNAITANRRKFANTIESQAAELGKDPAEVALEYVNENIGTLQRYVTMGGEKPLDNPAELALQAYLIRNNDVQTVQDIIGCSREDAEMYLDESEAKAIQLNDADADNFLGEIFEAVGRVAAKGAQKIAEKRQAQGKKPGLWGFIAGTNKPGSQLASDEQSGKGLDNLKVFAKDVLDDIKKAEKKKEINKLLPFIIIGIIVLILTVVLITKHANKS